MIAVWYLLVGIQVELLKQQKEVVNDTHVCFK